MGKGNLLAIAGIAIVAFIVIAYVIVPSVNMPNSMNLQWSVYGLKDNKRVTPPLAFVAQGIEIEALGAECTWSAQGESVDWDTLLIDGVWAIYLLAYGGDEPIDITPSDLTRHWVSTGVSAKEGSTSFNYLLSDLILGRPFSFEDHEGSYWDVRIELHVVGSVNQAVGSDVIQDRLDDFVEYRIHWQDGTFELQGGIV